MVRHLIDSEDQNEAAIRAFNSEGYQFSKEETRRDKEPVFVR